ncbi:MAG TPA: response regulator transcription factor [Gaiellaceae bacterium]|jgi:two-component system response regulator RegX3|nr:response regulator transcription factor [Gaiellaceae bacterium]
MNRILVVDDEPAIRDAVGYALRTEGFDVHVVADGEEAVDAALDSTYDVVVLDLMLPRMSGTEVCRRVRAESAVPIIMLTARGAELDRVLGLEVGADDYVTKPFSMAELIGRIRAILRRRELDQTSGGGRLRVGTLELDPRRHQVSLDGEPKRLTPSEFKLLLLLAEQPERVFSRREIMQHLWDSEYVGDQRACDIHISNLRQKLEEDPANPERIVTVRGVGYKLAAV